MSGHHHFLPLLLLFLLVSLHHSLTYAKRCHPDDERALLRIKAHFNNAPFFSTWTPQTACCRKWNLVSCKRLPDSKTFRVNFLEISGEEGINGEIPSAVGDLPYLETLIFRLLPNLTGPIPPAIGQLTQLQLLFLNWNDLTGPIPPFLSRLTNLSTLGLNNNRLTGRIPAYLGRLPNLGALWLYSNRLTGPIPDSFGSLQNGTVLQLYDNQLSGPIPRSMGRVSFGVLELENNQLTGDASFLFGEHNDQLAHLDLSGNRLSFDLSKTVMTADELVNLLVFDISRNRIYGQMPSWLGQASSVYQFNVSYNQLCGPIPTGGKLQQFDASAFSNNKCLCGAPLPPCKAPLN